MWHPSLPVLPVALQLQADWKAAGMRPFPLRFSLLRGSLNLLSPFCSFYTPTFQHSRSKTHMVLSLSRIPYSLKGERSVKTTSVLSCSPNPGGSWESACTRSRVVISRTSTSQEFLEENSALLTSQSYRGDHTVSGSLGPQTVGSFSQCEKCLRSQKQY